MALGFEEARVTPLGGDGGVDVRGTLVVGEVVRIRMAVQAKRWKGNGGAPVVQQVRGSLGAHEQGLIITTSDFSRSARTEAMRADAAPVALMNGEQLATVLAEREVGGPTGPLRPLLATRPHGGRGVMVRRNVADGAAAGPRAGHVRVAGRARVFFEPVDDWARVA